MKLRLSLLLPLLVACGAEPSDTSTTRQGINRIPCNVTADCAVRGGSCVAGQCEAGNECSTDADCPRGEVCTADVNFGGLCGVPGTTPSPAPVPPPAEDCTNGSDDDGDGDADCADSDCAADPACAPPAEDCTNGTDDDGDGDADCADADCAGDPACAPPAEDCSNAADDDGDGDVDCADLDCVREPACNTGCNGNNCPCDVLAQNCTQPGHRCYPGGPNAADGQCYPTGGQPAGAACVEPPVDTPDACTAGLLCIYAAQGDPTGICRVICATSADCAAGESCFAVLPQPTDFGVCAPTPAEDCSNGTDDDGDGDVDCADGDCAADPVCQPPPPPEDCSNGVDDDGDGAVDCADTDCARVPGCP